MPKMQFSYGVKDHYRDITNQVFTKCIYGNCITELDHELDDYGALPSEFTVITNGLPIKYWSENDQVRGIDHNNIIWLNTADVQDQLIANLKDFSTSL